MPAAQFTLDDLAQFAEFDMPYRDPFFPTIIYTPGIKFIRDHGCHWLISDMAAQITANPLLTDDSYTITADPVARCTSYYAEDGSLALTQDYAGYDCPVPFTVLAAPTVCNNRVVCLLHLPQELD